MIYGIMVALNDRPQAMLNGYKAGDPLVPVGRALVVDAVDDAAALEAAFALGNRFGADRNEQQWPSGVRSVSVGDVVELRHLSGRSRFAVEPLGWKPLAKSTNSLTLFDLVMEAKGDFSRPLALDNEDRGVQPFETVNIVDMPTPTLLLSR